MSNQLQQEEIKNKCKNVRVFFITFQIILKQKSNNIIIKMTHFLQI